MPEKSVINLALELQILSLTNKKQFIKAFFSALPEKQKEVCLETAFKSVYKDLDIKLRAYLDSIFNKDLQTTPIQAARLARYYLKFKPVMMPYLIKQARRAKDRIKKRLQRRNGRKI